MISMSSCRFLHDEENCSEVAYSKYHSLFFIRLLNFCGLRSLSRWNLQHMAASCSTRKDSAKGPAARRRRTTESLKCHFGISKKTHRNSTTPWGGRPKVTNFVSTTTTTTTTTRCVLRPDGFAAENKETQGAFYPVFLCVYVSQCTYVQERGSFFWFAYSFISCGGGDIKRSNATRQDEKKGRCLSFTVQ